MRLPSVPWISIVNGDAGLTKPVSAIAEGSRPVAQDRDGVVVHRVTGHPAEHRGHGVGHPAEEDLVEVERMAA